ncbi:MAG: hypothetical protein ABI806_23225 [Candidatus Solibacter sp.]
MKIPPSRTLYVFLAAKYTEQPAHEAALFLPDKIEFPLIQPDAFASEALIDADTAESDFIKLHTALRAPHEVERTIPLPVLRQQISPPFGGGNLSAFDFQEGKVLLFTLNA